MIGTLVAHSGAVKATRQDLESIAPPAGTTTWKPVRHAELVSVIRDQLETRGLAIREETYAVQRDGALLFGVLDLAWRENGEFAAALGLRTANDKTMAIQIAVGIRVFVCDNLVFSGDLIALRRKHTAKLDLPREIARAIDRYQEGALALERGIERLRDAAISEHEAKARIFDVFEQAILPIRFFRPVCDAYFRPAADASDVKPRTLWGLHNAMTRQVRRMSPAPAFQATVELGKLFGLGQCPSLTGVEDAPSVKVRP
jgi:hypothetical protein